MNCLVSLLPDCFESHNQVTDKEELLASSFGCHIMTVSHCLKT